MLLMPIAHHLGLSMYNVLLDSGKYLLSYSTLINPLKRDVHYIKSQILLILIDFYPDLYHFLIIFPIFKPFYNSETRKDIKKR